MKSSGWALRFEVGYELAFISPPPFKSVEVEQICFKTQNG